MTVCSWAGSSPVMQAYHDQEWGHPEHDAQKTFELLSLEIFQAGLSWQTVLNKRAAFRKAFANFDPTVVAAYTEDDVARLLADAAIIRNRRKILATISNAQAILALAEKTGFSDFSAYLWHFTDGKVVHHQPTTMADVPSRSPLSETVAKDLKRLGFKFVGPTVVYAFLQATGVIDDHLVGCPAKPVQ